MRLAGALIRRDLTLAFRSGGGGLSSIVFYALVVVIFALAAGPDRARLAGIATPVLWTGAVLAAMLSFEKILQADFEDGSLDAILETTDFVSLAVLAKAAAHWLSTIVPLLIATPVLGVLLNLPSDAFAPLLLSMAIGTPALSLFGALAAALTLTLRRAAVLMTILTAPLLTPVIVFGVGAAKAGAAGDPLFAPSLMILGAVTLISLVLAPIAAAAAIRFNME